MGQMQKTIEVINQWMVCLNKDQNERADAQLCVQLLLCTVLQVGFNNNREQTWASEHKNDGESFMNVVFKCQTKYNIFGGTECFRNNSFYGVDGTAPNLTCPVSFF